MAEEKEQEKKFYELDVKQRKEIIRLKWKKVKPLIKRIFFIIICILAIFLMFISVFPSNR